MAVSDTQKLDYTWKKLGFGLTKTDVPKSGSVGKEAFNESIPSPLLLRADKVWQFSGSIPGVIPSSSAGVVTVYKDGAATPTAECTEDIDSPARRTWKTNLTDWISPEFGSTYQIKVYIDSASAAAPQTTGTQAFAAGASVAAADQWFFDYQSGVLHFLDSNLPAALTSGKKIYISGARYTGAFGVGGAAGQASDLANFHFEDNTMSTTNSNGAIILDPAGTGTIILNSKVGINSASAPAYSLSVIGTDAILVPVGTSSNRPATVTDGLIRYNTTTADFEGYSNGSWKSIGSTVTASVESFTGDNVTTAFTLAKVVDQNLAIVTLSGVLQNPGDSYSVTGNILTFSEAPGTDLEIRVRAFGSISALTASISSNTIESVTSSGKIIDAWPYNSKNSADYFIQATNSTGALQNIKMQVLTNGTTVVKNEYGHLETSTNLMELSVALNAGQVEVTASATAGNTLTIKWSRTLL
jgi:hypothetical protein